jgi:hypothetical protein
MRQVFFASAAWKNLEENGCGVRPQVSCFLLVDSDEAGTLPVPWPRF